MKYTLTIGLLLNLLICLLNVSKVQAQEVLNVAVAANFIAPMKDIVAKFEYHHSAKIYLISGSSGKLFAQIQNGAPYHLFFSADQTKPMALEGSKFAIANSRFTYAQGQLALWSAKSELTLDLNYLAVNEFNHLAVANPNLAPYGNAAMSLLKHIELYQGLENKLVYGENVAQALQFVLSGNAQLGLIALSQYRAKSCKLGGSIFIIPQGLYPAVIQDAILLKKAKGSATALAFRNYFNSQEVANILLKYGYLISKGEKL